LVFVAITLVVLALAEYIAQRRAAVREVLAT
jgi:hypothetical protein